MVRNLRIYLMKRQSYIWATAYWKSMDGVANSQAHIKIWWIFQIMWIKTMILFHILDSNTYNKLTVVQIHMWLLWRKQNDDNDKNRNRYQFIVSAFSYHLIFLSSSIFQRKKKCKFMETNKLSFVREPKQQCRNRIFPK